MKYLLTLAAFVATLWATAIAAVFAVIALAGPHSAPLSKPMEMLVHVVAGGAVLVLPVLAARTVWRRHGRAPSEVTPHE